MLNEALRSRVGEVVDNVTVFFQRVARDIKAELLFLLHEAFKRLPFFAIREGDGDGGFLLDVAEDAHLSAFSFCLSRLRCLHGAFYVFKELRSVSFKQIEGTTHNEAFNGALVYQFGIDAFAEIL